MKKGSTQILVTVTVAFVMLLIGFVVGKNVQASEVTMRISAESTTSPSFHNSTIALDSQVLPTMQSDSQITLGRKININIATVEELDALPGIGPVIAQRIIDYRNTNGAFQDVNDLINVSGIGEKKLKAIIELITAEDAYEDSGS